MIDTIKKHFRGPGGISMMLGIAVPMIISNAAEMIMMFVDRLFLARLGREHLSAAMTGGLTMFMLMTFFLGVVGYVNALVAQHYGAGQKKRCGLSAAQGLIFALAGYPLVLLATPVGRWLLSLAGHDPLQHELEVVYFSILAWGSIMGLLRAALSGFFCGIGRTGMVMFANILAMLVNVVANYILIFGKLGFPALGMAGAAYGTLMGSATGLLVMGVAYFGKKVQEEFDTLIGLRFDRQVFRTLIKFGLPSGIEFFLNLAAFNAFVQVFHSYGSDAAAAITIVFNWDLVAFFPLFGFNMAVMSLVGRYMGAGQPDMARRSAFSGLKAASVYGAAMGFLFLFAPGPLVRMFVQGTMESEYAAVMPMAIKALRIAAIYTFSDCVLIVFSGALRGAGDTQWTMRTSVLIHWLMTGVCLVLIKVLKVPPLFSWLAFSLMVLVLVWVFTARFLGGKWEDIQVIES